MSLILFFTGREPEFTTEALKSSSGMQKEQPTSVGLGINKKIVIPNVLCEKISIAQPIKTSISGAYEQTNLILRNKLSIGNEVSISQALMNKIGSYSAQFKSTSYDLYLDEENITSLVPDIRIGISEDVIHNSITFTSNDDNLRLKCDPSIKYGESRITVEVGNRTFYFLLEKCVGNETTFSVWGRSISAREDSPYAEDMNYSISTPTLASTIASSLTTYASVSWECFDWVVPTTFEFTGPPIAGIVALAQAVGAIVRSDDDGNLTVRKRFPVRPINMIASASAVSYDREDIIKGINHSLELGKGYNQIDVYGQEATVIDTDLRVENEKLIKGEDVYLRVYWNGEIPDSTPTVIASDGNITSLGVKTEDEEETVHFVEGVASTTFPVYDLKSVTLYGNKYGGRATNLQYNVRSKNLVLPYDYNDGYLSAKVKYSKQFYRYKLTGHNSDYIVAVVYLTTGEGIYVRVSIGSGDTPANPIQSYLLSSNGAAVELGTAWLDYNKYDRRIFNFQVPYEDEAVDGALAHINEAELGCKGNFHIKTADIVITGPAVVNNLEVLQCQL